MLAQRIRALNNWHSFGFFINTSSGNPKCPICAGCTGIYEMDFTRSELIARIGYEMGTRGQMLAIQKAKDNFYIRTICPQIELTAWGVLKYRVALRNYAEPAWVESYSFGAFSTAIRLPGGIVAIIGKYLREWHIDFELLERLVHDTCKFENLTKKAKAYHKDGTCAVCLLADNPKSVLSELRHITGDGNVLRLSILDPDLATKRLAGRLRSRAAISVVPGAVRADAES